VLEVLLSLDWIGRINEMQDEEATRYVLLGDMSSTRISPLVDKLLLTRTDATSRFWERSTFSGAFVKEVL
jgi:membrane protein